MHYCRNRFSLFCFDANLWQHHPAMNETLRLRTALARLGKDELRKVADLAKVPLRSLQRFADGELDDLPHTQFIDVRSAYRKTQVFA